MVFHECQASSQTLTPQLYGHLPFQLPHRTYSDPFLDSVTLQLQDQTLN